MALTARLFEKAAIFLEMIKFEHTVFALPFAYIGLWLAEDGHPRLENFLGVTAAMVALRTLAMSFNRVADLAIDRSNPRTQERALVKGLLSMRFVIPAMVLSGAVYFLAAAWLKPLCLMLSPIPLILVLIYPYLKTFTWFSHFVLGMILGMAPAAGWIASRATVSMECWILFGAVLFWVAGFDMIYALQDMAFDRAHGFRSFPAAFGKEKTILAVRFAHALTLLLLVWLGWADRLGALYWAGLMLAVAFLAREQWLVTRGGDSKIQEAFFQMNARVSLVLFVATSLDLFISSWSPF
jgi:4-hydroxybenzoate polyprenyltransferase